jgi:thymidylate kinase
MSHKIFQGDQGIGTPEKPLRRRDKNVSSWPVIVLRFFFYLADAISLAACVHRLKQSDAQVVIFDRYIYDELANLPLHHQFTRSFVNFVLTFAPRPDVACIIDADPVAAYARKPEYPLEFVQRNRESYIALSRLMPRIAVIAPLPVEDMAAEVREKVLQEFASPADEFAVPVLS